jgi:hypothetical protein
MSVSERAPGSRPPPSPWPPKHPPPAPKGAGLALPRPRRRRPAERSAADGRNRLPDPTPPPCRPPSRRWPSHRDGRGNGEKTAGILRRRPRALPRRPSHPLRPLPGIPAGPNRRAPSASLPAISSAFDSLLRVLFIFPSRYLFAIGLSPVFSLGWGLPPAWGCIPEQPDSGGQQRPTRGRRDPNLRLPHGALTLRGTPSQGISRGLLGEGPHDVDPRGYNSGCLPTPGFGAWALPASLAATRGILVGFFSSA